MIPLGLGLRLWKIPYVTIALALVLLCVYRWGSQNSQDVTDFVLHTFQSNQLGFLEDDLFAEYCVNRGGDLHVCQYLGKFFEAAYLDDSTASKPSTNDELSGRALPILHHRMTFYLQMIRDFKGRLQEPISPLYNLRNAKPYFAARARSFDSIIRYYNNHAVLSRSTVTPWALFKAQWEHASPMHLIGNLVFLVLFGSYVEARMSPLVMFGGYLLGGMLGLLLQTSLFGDPSLYVVGASANISALMGMFFVLFFGFRMRFLIFTGQVISLPVAWAFPAFYLLQDLLGAAGVDLEANHVAHLAHLGGMALGGYIAYVWESYYRLPKPFLFKRELEAYQSLQVETDEGQIIRQSRRILLFNPDNYMVRELLLRRLIDSQTPLTPWALRTLAQEVPRHISQIFKKAEPTAWLQILKQLLARAGLPQEKLKPFLVGLSVQRLDQMRKKAKEHREEAISHELARIIKTAFPGSRWANDIETEETQAAA